MGSAPIKWTCTASFDFSGQDSWLTGPYWPLGRRRKKKLPRFDLRSVAFVASSLDSVCFWWRGILFQAFQVGWLLFVVVMALLFSAVSFWWPGWKLVAQREKGSIFGSDSTCLCNCFTCLICNVGRMRKVRCVKNKLQFNNLLNLVFVTWLYVVLTQLQPERLGFGIQALEIKPTLQRSGIVLGLRTSGWQLAVVRLPPGPGRESTAEYR